MTEYSFDISLVIHDADVSELESIMATLVDQFQKVCHFNKHDVHIWSAPRSIRDGVHSTCDKGVCLIEAQRAVYGD